MIVTHSDNSSPSPSAGEAKGFWAFLWRVATRLVEPTFTLSAAGVAFYAFLAIFPAIAVAVSIYGLVTDADTVQHQSQAVEHLLPDAAGSLINNALHGFAVKNRAELNTALAISFLVTLWSARAGTSSLMSALNVVFHREETRGLIFQQLMAIGLTLAAVVLGIAILAGTTIIPLILQFLLPHQPINGLILWLRWPLLFVMIVLVLSAIYKFAPCRPRARFRISIGAITATVLWIIGSALFSVYITNSPSYDAIYGSLTAVVVLLLWLWVSAFVILTGACIDAEREPVKIMAPATALKIPAEESTPGLPFVPWDVLFGRKTEPD